MALLDENEFLSPGGIRSLSKIHEKTYKVKIEGKEFGLNYQPGESNSDLFGGNTNWRGPVWIQMNHLIILALERYYKYFNDELQVELPAHSGNMVNLKTVANELRNRLTGMFVKNSDGKRLLNGGQDLFNYNEHFEDLIQFYECFHGDNCRGVGATHQTGWTGLIAIIIEELHSLNVERN